MDTAIVQENIRSLNKEQIQCFRLPGDRYYLVFWVTRFIFNKFFTILENLSSKFHTAAVASSSTPWSFPLLYLLLGGASWWDLCPAVSFQWPRIRDYHNAELLIKLKFTYWTRSWRSILSLSLNSLPSRNQFWIRWWCSNREMST